MIWRMKPNSILAVFMVFVLARPASADPPENSPGEVLDIDALVREAGTIIDAVLVHHFAPPSRQEMWLGGATSMANPVMFDRGKVQPRFKNLRFGKQSERISQMKSSEEFAGFLKELWSDRTFPTDRVSTGDLKEAFCLGILATAPGNAQRIPRSELKVREQFEGNRYIGTGIANGFDEERGYPTIAKVIPGGPMARAGGRHGDLILKIDLHDAYKMPMARVIELLRGEEGTTVTVELCAPAEFQQEVRPGVPGAPAGRDGAVYADNSRTIVVKRGPVILETLQGLRKNGDGWDYRITSSSAFRYVNVGLINGSTVHDLRQLERQFRVDGAAAVILDFRSIEGGDLHHAVLFADALMDGGLIGRVRTKGHVQEFRADRDCLFRDWPITLLVNNHTRGGGEWIAAALQDNRRGLIIGETTAGDAFVDSTIVMPESGDGLRLPTGRFERPSGRSFQSPGRWPQLAGSDSSAGIRPDRIVNTRQTGGLPSDDNDSLPVRGTGGSTRPDPILEAAVVELEHRMRRGERSDDR